ncbi:MAG: S-methyl-5'-thioinosine phosphorylase [Candidatus Accumulibacter sp.]|jgi:5'-methylthioadenosine phosphorylase|nr:S-methyl-5'-thioinosine phosphorylase [Accumulibacter sp.]
MLAIIGGSGLTQLANLDVSHREVLRTPYGEPSGALTFGRVRGHPVAFLARHGYGHVIPPHAVNYRANIWALAKRGAEAIVSVASVGGIRPDLKPGDLLIPHQIIDYTWGRKSTYHEGQDGAVVHIDFTEPYDPSLRARLAEAAKAAGVALGDAAVYAVTQGPRLETSAEIDRLERDGADVVGMTGMPEAALARELGVPYAAVNVVANYAAGRAGSRGGIRVEAIGAVLAESMGRVRAIIENLAQSLVDHGDTART